jgi:hypothetical protein
METNRTLAITSKNAWHLHLLENKQSKMIAKRKYLKALQQANTILISSSLVISSRCFVFSKATLFPISCNSFL